METEILNFMIANKCGVTYEEDDPEEEGIVTAAFDLHCMLVTIKARFIGNWETNDVRYEIISWEKERI